MKKNTWIVVLSVFAIFAIMFTFIFSSFDWLYLKEYEATRMGYSIISFISVVLACMFYNIDKLP